MIKFCIALTVALLSLAPCRALQRTDTVMGNLTNYDRDDLDVNVRVGW